MRHPLDFIPATSRKLLFFTFLILTLGLFAVFQILDGPIKTPAAPNGIVSFELAGSSAAARAMINSWDASARLNTAFGLGLDYLFMPVYATAIALAALLAAGKHPGGYASLGVVAGYGAYVAALFDAVENYALWQILTGDVASAWSSVAAICAAIKFIFFIGGVLYGLVGWLMPKRA